MHNPNIWKDYDFRFGDLVHISDVSSPHYAELGRILAILINKHAHSADRYDVVFADGRSVTFLDAQLGMKLT